MTQALMDLGPRVDTKPAGVQGKSGGAGGSGSDTDSAAAFADAVDQAVGEASTSSGSVSRRDSGRENRGDTHDDKPAGRDKADKKNGDPDRDAAAAAIWALAPQSLPGAQMLSKGVARGATAETSAVKAVGAESILVGKPAGTATKDVTANSATKASEHTPFAADLAAANTAVAKGTDGGRSADTTAALAARANAKPGALGTAAAADAKAGAPGATDKVSTTASGSDTADAKGARGAQATNAPTSATATSATASSSSHASSADDSALGLRNTNAAGAVHDSRRTDGTTKDGAKPGAAGGTSTSSTLSAATQVSPTSIHVPTLVGATINSTPVAVATPTLTAPPQMQPNVANILAQLRGAADGTYQLRAQVHPAELGAVSISATVQHGVLSVLLSPDPTAQQAISQSLPQLRQHLVDQGFTGVNVGLGSPNQPGHNGQGGGERGSRAQGSGHSSHHGQGNAIGALNAPVASTHGLTGASSALDRLL
ncbi:MAG: flagellar hook-length control protein FliK [Nakamurella sp.]